VFGICSRGKAVRVDEVGPRRNVEEGELFGISRIVGAPVGARRACDAMMAFNSGGIIYEIL
jgi:hypothetical protein